MTRNIDFPDTKGKCNGLNKLNNENIFDVINCIKKGFSDTEIANKFNVNRKTISDIRNHKTWVKFTKDLIFQKSNGMTKGENNNKSKLTLKQVEEIKKKLLSSCISMTSLAREYNVSSTTISNIKNNKIYKYI